MKYFFLGLIVVLSLGIGMVVYGSYLNYRSEHQIMERMAEQAMFLSGERARMRSIHPQITLDVMRLSVDDMADAVALVDGRIINCLVKKNQHVRAGEVLVELNKPELAARIKQAESNRLKAETELTHARNMYSRYERLRARDATSAEKFEEAQSAYQAAVANVEAIEAQKEELLVQFDQQQVVSPIDGEVLIVYRTTGSYVAAGTAVALVGNFKVLRFSTPVDDNVANQLYIGKEDNVYFSQNDLGKVYDTEYSVGNLGTTQGIKAQIVEISPSLEESATMRKVTWEIDNSSGLLEPQTYGGVKLSSAEEHKCLTVPLISMTDSTRTSLFVYRDNGTIAKRNVETGVNDGKYIEILSGLQEGETVITSDPDGLIDGMKVKLKSRR